MTVGFLSHIQGWPLGININTFAFRHAQVKTTLLYSTGLRSGAFIFMPDLKIQLIL